MSLQSYEADVPLDELMRLLQACTAGDEAAQAEFRRRYDPLVRTWIRVRGLATLADNLNDIVQAFWLKKHETEFAFLLRYKPRPGLRFETYLRVVVRRFARDWLEKEANHRKLFERGDLERAIDPGPTAEEHHRADVLLALLWPRLTSLERQVLDLKLRGYDPAGIALEIGRKRNHVDQVLHRVRAEATRILGLSD